MGSVDREKAKADLEKIKDPYQRVATRINLEMVALVEEEARRHRLLTGSNGLEGDLILAVLARSHAFVVYNIIGPLCVEQKDMPRILGMYMNMQTDSICEILHNMQTPEGVTKQ